MWVSDLRGSPDVGKKNPAEEPWVTGAPAAAQRVPGIDETPDTTYVDPTTPHPRRAILIGVAVGLAVTAIVGAIVASARSTDDPTAKAGPSATASRSSSTTEPSTTTTVASPSTTALPVSNAPVTSATTVPAPPPPTPRATANPAAAPYVDVPMPSGVSATLTSCAWQPTNGGQYEAAGTVTNAPSTNRGWTLTMHWLQNQRELAQQSAEVDLGAGQSKPWSLTLGAPTPPADPFSCSLSGA